MNLFENLRLSRWRGRNKGYNWDNFDPNLYHEHNYVEIDPVDDEVLTDLVHFYQKEKPNGKFLEVGAGSNMYPILAALPYADSISIWEYGAQNVEYLKKQIQELDPSWQKWIDRLRELDPETYGQVDFQQQLAEKVSVTQGSIFNLPQNEFDNISMHSVIESLTKSSHEFKRGLRRFVAAGKPRATVAATFVEKSAGYDSPGKQFPALSIEAWDAVRIFGRGMKSLQFGSTKAEIRPGSPLIFTFGRIK